MMQSSDLGVELELLCADNDPITQSQQLLKVIQSARESRPGHGQRLRLESVSAVPGGV